MKRIRLWFITQKAYVRFLLMFAITFSGSIVFMLIVNALSGESWYRGIFVGLIAGALLSAWSLSDKKFYEDNQKKKS
jgi:hypothetical protein